MLCWRWQGHPTMLHRMCDLPFGYYCEPRLRCALLPTLLCACLHDPFNLRILSSRLAPAHLLNFIRINASPPPPPGAPGAPGAPGNGSGALAEPYPTTYTPPAALVDDPSELPVVSMEYALAARLPPHLWPEALSFFATRPASPVSDGVGARGVEPPPLAARDSEMSGCSP
jgi:hypothetical protein